LAAATKLVADTFASETTNAVSQSQRAALSAKMLQTAVEEQSDMAGKYVLFGRARDLAVEAGDLNLAFKVIDQLAASFVVDDLRMKRDAAAALAKSPGVDQASFATSAEVLANEAQNANQNTLSESLDDLAITAARQSHDPQVLRDITAQSKHLTERRAMSARVKAALVILKAKPGDPESNLEVGRYKCFFEGNWKDGLPFLAQGSDRQLKGLALSEIHALSNPAGMNTLADGWWSVGENETGTARFQLQVHAGSWYDKAITGLTGLAKARAQKRLEDAESARVQLGSLAPVARWTVLFRSDDPAIWDHPQGSVLDNSGFAAAIDSTAPDKTRYLRMRRTTDGDSIIIPMTKSELHEQTDLWCGSDWNGYNALHLGIKNPQWRRVEKGLVDIDGNRQGWGFGHVMYVDKPGINWAGRDIAKCVIEIAVTDQDLTAEEEKLVLRN
jgi:hypothetical protein